MSGRVCRPSVPPSDEGKRGARASSRYRWLVLQFVSLALHAPDELPLQYSLRPGFASQSGSGPTSALNWLIGVILMLEQPAFGTAKLNSGQ